MIAAAAVALTLLAAPVDRTPPPSRAVSPTLAAARVPGPWTAFARCVEHRESQGQPGVVNNSSGAQGLYQFMPAWNRGLPWMVAARLRANGMTRAQADRVRRYLSARPIHHWPATYQRIGFAAVIATPSGWRHWAGGHGCNGLAAS